MNFVKENGISQRRMEKAAGQKISWLRTWFRSFKYEEAYLTQYNNIKEARIVIEKYIHTYSFEQRHFALNYQTPDEYYYSAMLMPYVA